MHFIEYSLLWQNRWTGARKFKYGIVEEHMHTML